MNLIFDILVIYNLRKNWMVIKIYVLKWWSIKSVDALFFGKFFCEEKVSNEFDVFD